jgi:predicted DCC family thiol-disulfide oxidoreductase YuxK
MTRPKVAPNEIGGPVLLFDGECGLCQRIVRILLRLDRRGRLRFAPLQGRSAQEFLRAHGLATRDFSSLVFVPDWDRRDRPEFLLRTDGALAALRTASTWGRLFAPFGWLPRAWRDAAYRTIARSRHRLFGEWRPRPLPRPEWASRFLD